MPALPPLPVQCPNCGAEDTTMGIEIPGVYDGILYWHCVACKGGFHRFPEGHYLRQRAEAYVDGT